jgi:hypothetical protein
MTKALSLVLWVACAGAVGAVACGSDTAGTSGAETDAGTGGARPTSMDASRQSEDGAVGTGGRVGDAGSGLGGAGAGATGSGGDSSGGTDGGGVTDGGATGGGGTDGGVTDGGSTGGTTGGADSWACEQADTACLCVAAATPTDTCTLPKAACCFTYTGASGVGNCQCWDIEPSSSSCMTLTASLGGAAVSTCPRP